MRILVFSDSHCALSFMRYCMDKVKPDAVIHLGDHYEDARAIAEENMSVIFHQVPGNCDHARVNATVPQVLCYSVGGVRFFMTHGHKHHVKLGLGALLADARRSNAQAVLYGHTHRPDCHCQEDGLWVINPGTCGGYGGTAAIIETQENKIKACRIVRQAELEEMI